MRVEGQSVGQILSGIRWGWVVLGAVLTEVCTFPVMMAFMWVYGFFGVHEIGAFEPKGLLLSPPIFLVAALPFGLWTAVMARQRFVLHGALVGLIAALLFLPVLIGMPQSWAPPGPNYYGEVFNSSVKVIGGALGGAIAARFGKRAL
jgi:hypothetical protein